MRLSEHFTLEEFTYSDTACKYRASNEPTATHKQTLIHTCEYFFEPLRKLLNEYYIGRTYKNKKIKKATITITSGYRSENVNLLLEREGYKPSRTSQHCKGEAGDFVVVLVAADGTLIEVPYNETYCLVKGFVKNNKLSVDQLIQEKQGSKIWVHVSYKAGGASVNRKQFLKTFDGVNFIADTN